MKSSSKLKKKINASSPKGWKRLLFDPRVLTLLGLLCFLPLVVSVAGKFGSSLLEEKRFQVTRDSFQINEAPEGVPNDILARVWREANLPEEFSILEPGLSKKLGEAFEQSPWIAKVKHLELKPASVVKVELEYRVPVALVKSAHGYFPIDRDGVLLPPADFSAADLARYPLIVSPRSNPQGPAGTHWGDLSIWGAARLAEILTPDHQLKTYWKKYDLASIQFSGEVNLLNASPDQLRRVTYRLVTKKGSEIIWGIAPEIPDPAEPDAKTKLKRLALYFQNIGGTTAGQKPVEIDLRRWKNIARRPLPVSTERTTLQ